MIGPTNHCLRGEGEGPFTRDENDVDLQERIEPIQIWIKPLEI